MKSLKGRSRTGRAIGFLCTNRKVRNTPRKCFHRQLPGMYIFSHRMSISPTEWEEKPWLTLGAYLLPSRYWWKSQSYGDKKQLIFAWSTDTLGFSFPGRMYLADFGISKSSEDASKLQELGILAGQIPTAIKTGGTQRMPHELWDGTLSGESCGSWVAWFAPKQLSQHTLILGNKEPAISLLGLDLFWLAFQSAFYHFSEGIDSSFHHVC